MLKIHRKTWRRPECLDTFSDPAAAFQTSSCVVLLLELRARDLGSLKLRRVLLTAAIFQPHFEGSELAGQLCDELGNGWWVLIFAADHGNGGLRRISTACAGGTLQVHLI